MNIVNIAKADIGSLKKKKKKKVDAKNYLIFKYVVENTRLKQKNHTRQTKRFFFFFFLR